MSTNKTEHYQLNQWVKSDQVLMDDFNADNRKIDGALRELAQSAAGAGNCEMEVLTYTGTGAYGVDDPTKITFSAVPDVYMIVGDATACLGQGNKTTALLISDSYVVETSPTWNGHQMKLINSLKARYQMNVKGKLYWVLGLRKKG